MLRKGSIVQKVWWRWWERHTRYGVQSAQLRGPQVQAWWCTFVQLLWVVRLHVEAAAGLATWQVTSRKQLRSRC